MAKLNPPLALAEMVPDREPYPAEPGTEQQSETVDSDPRVRVLAIDDDADLLENLTESLKPALFRVITATMAEEFFAQLEKFAPDFVITDLQMPSQDGIETLLEMKKIRPGTRIFVMSGGGRAGLTTFLDVAMKFGAAGQLRKPLTFGDMVACLNPPVAAV